jgi:hypothetical protein
MSLSGTGSTKCSGFSPGSPPLTGPAPSPNWNPDPDCLAHLWHSRNGESAEDRC